MDTTNEGRVMAYVQDHMNTIPFKTLRHGEAELPIGEKLVIMQKTLRGDPALFLSKWGRYLSQRILTLFQQIEGNYEVDFYLDSLLYNEEHEQMEEARQTYTKKSALHTQIQNRRYEYLKRYLKDSDYYSDESIQLREPIVYDQYVGQHVSTREKEQPFGKDVTLVNRILSNIDKKYVSDHLQQQKDMGDEQMEEEEEESEDDELFEKSTPIVITKKKSKEVEMTEASIDEDEVEEVEDMEGLMEFREEQRLEMIRLLEEKFLAGKDDDFDYDQVDYNEDYDDLEQQERDIQDRYFDEN